MKRIRKRSILALMVMLTLCLNLVSAYATPYQMAVPVSSEIIFDGINQRDIPVIGILSNTKPNKCYTFILQQNSYVEIDNVGAGDVPIMILDDEGYVLGSSTVYSQEGYDRYKIYLMAGTYELFVGTEYPTGGEGYKFNLNFTACGYYESFPESPTKNNDMPKNADSMILDKTIIGLLCANEACVMKETLSSPATDFYKFEVVGAEEGEQQIEINLLYDGPIQAYILKSDGNIVAHRFENLPVPGSGLPNNVYETFGLEDGIYYLGIESLYETGSAYYTVKLKDVSRTFEYDRSIMYTTVGEDTAIFNKLDHYPLVVTDHWESYYPEIAEVKKVGGVNVLSGKKAGRTVIYGYPDKNGFHTSRIVMESMVEFKDVRHYDETYYYFPVYWAVDNGITMGIMDKDGVYRTFGPQKNCTRAQIVTFLWRMEGCPEPETYTSYNDVKTTDYFYKAVCWAQENEITKGYPDGTFKPQNVCSRSQVVTFLWRLAGEPEPENPGSFPDVQDPETYFYEAVSWAAENQITEGYPDGKFKPTKNCTRAQTVTFLYRYDDKFGPKG